MHLHGIDLLRGIAAFGIVGCHLALWDETEGARNLRWFCDMFVGLFASLSGLLMAKYHEGQEGAVIVSWWQYIRKRAKRILPTYMVWTLVYILFGLIFDYLIRKELNPKWLRTGYITEVVFLGSASTHLWFLISLFYCQLIFGLVLMSLRKVPWWFWMISGGLVVGYASVSCKESWLSEYPLRLLGFLVTGYGVSQMPFVFGNSWRWCWWIVLAFTATVHFFCRGIPAFARDWMVVVPMLVCAAKSRIDARFGLLVSCLGTTSMGVFLIHPIFAAGIGLVIRKHYATPFGAGPVALDWLLVWVVSFLFALIACRIPIVKRIVK